jgi:hypothetical protein
MVASHPVGKPSANYNPNLRTRLLAAAAADLEDLEPQLLHCVKHAEQA